MPPKRPAKKRVFRKSTGLNKKEKSQVKTLAKQAVQVVAEKKFMDSEQYEDQLLVPAHTNSRIAVIGYSTTERVSNEGSAVMYGTSQVKEGLCLRPFLAGDKEDVQDKADLGRYSIVGKSVMPRTCHSRWRFQRAYSVLDNGGEGLTGDTHPFHLPATTGGIADSLPVYFRIIRVTMKGQSGSSVTHSPSQDLFLDKYGEPTGVSHVDDAGNFDFEEQDLLFCKVNTRKYQVIEEKRFTLRPPMTLSHTAMDSTATGYRVYLPMITNTNANCEKYLNFNHQLSRRKNGRVHYNSVTTQDPENPELTHTNTNATSGMRREYVFVNAIYQGGSVAGFPFDPDNPNPYQSIKWSLMNSTTFTDV